jgi:hypothetical protein
MNARTHRIVVLFGLAVPCAVALAGGAQAATRPDDRGGSIGVGATQAVVASPDVLERAVLRESRGLVRPDDRAGMRGPGSAAVSTPTPDVFERAVLRESRGLVRPDDRAGMRGPGSAPVSSTIATSVEDSFGWGDVLFGAAAVLGLVLLGAAAAVTLVRRHRLILR